MDAVEPPPDPPLPQRGHEGAGPVGRVLVGGLVERALGVRVTDTEAVRGVRDRFVVVRAEPVPRGVTRGLLAHPGPSAGTAGSRDLGERQAAHINARSGRALPR